MHCSADAAVIPPLITSGSLCPVAPISLTTSYSDLTGALYNESGTCIAQSAVLHSDLTTIDLGAHCILRAGVVLRPPIRVYVNPSTAGAAPRVTVGSSVYMGPQVVCEAAEVGSFVRMDERCVVSAGVRVPDGVWLLPETWVPSEAVLAPYTVYSGAPACPVQKQQARVYQLLHLEFMRRVRAAAGVGASKAE